MRLLFVLLALMAGFEEARAAPVPLGCADSGDCPKDQKCVSGKCAPRVAPSKTPEALAQTGNVLSRTCQFNAGPRAGQTLLLSQRYYPQLDARRPGEACTDGFASSGRTVAVLKADPEAAAKDFSHTCHFTSGMLIGQTRYYDPALFSRAPSFPIGGQCRDGDSTGVTLADSSAAKPAAQEGSRTCRFTMGPRAGQIQFFWGMFYPGFQPLPVGTTCQDGFGSTGLTVVDSPLPATDNAADLGLCRTCRFTSGPQAGRTQFFSADTYPQMASFPIGTGCVGQDGSSGVAVDDSSSATALPGSSGLSRTCQFTTGPRRGQTQTLSPDQVTPYPLGASCQDPDGSIGVIVPDP